MHNKGTNISIALRGKELWYMVAIIDPLHRLDECMRFRGIQDGQALDLNILHSFLRILRWWIHGLCCVDGVVALLCQVISRFGLR